MKVAVQGTAKRIYNACVLQPNAYLARRSKAVRYDLRTILCGSFHKHLAGLQSLGFHSDVNLCIYNHRTFCKENKIETSFTLRGRTGKNEIKNAIKRNSI